MHDPTAPNHYPDRKTIAPRVDAARIHRDMLATVDNEATYHALLDLAVGFRGCDTEPNGARIREIISATVRRMVARTVGDLPEPRRFADEAAHIDAICTAWRILST